MKNKSNTPPRVAAGPWDRFLTRLDSRCCRRSVASTPATGRVPRAPRRAFTLVELLVVIVIITILAGLITVAATAALDKAHQTRIKVELDQLATAFKQYKNEHGSYPPNFANTRGTITWNGTSGWPASTPDIIRHFKKAFPRSKDALVLEQLLKNVNPPLDPAEAVVFWLGGFSADPEHPLIGPGGPLAPSTVSGSTSNLDDRTFTFEFDKSRLVKSRPTSTNPITITVGSNSWQVDLYQYHPQKISEPYVYFDTSRDIPMPPPVPPRYPSWPAYPDQTNPKVRAYIQAKASGGVEFVNPKSFQILSTGTDGEWGDVLTDASVLYPTGPWTDQTATGGADYSGHADNLVNFSPRTIEDSQK